MPLRRLAALCLLAAAAGAAAGWALRPSRPGRPASVEAVLRAVDRDDRVALESALRDAGEPSRYDAPWRAEVELGRAVLAGDPEGVWRLATEGPPEAAKARALLWLRARAQRAQDVDAWRRFEARLEADYPSSWALMRAPTPAGEGGR